MKKGCQQNDRTLAAGQAWVPTFAVTAAGMDQVVEDPQ